MNGAEAFIETLHACGVEVCFANPGTSEMQLVAAIDRQHGMRSILGLFEGVVTGAADGYGRMADKPAVTLLHLGPGLGNGLANLHNARKAGSPIINMVGEHATYHKHFNAPLTSDIVPVARTVSGFVRVASTAPQLGIDAADALAAARSNPGQIATLIVPGNAAWDEGGAIAPVAAKSSRASSGARKTCARISHFLPVFSAPNQRRPRTGILRRSDSGGAGFPMVRGAGA